MSKEDKQYVIQDQQTKNYLSPASFQMENYAGTKWSYITYTGIRTGFYSFGTKESAEETLSALQECNIKSGAGKIFDIVEINESNIPMGKRIIEDIGQVVKYA